MAQRKTQTEALAESLEAARKAAQLAKAKIELEQAQEYSVEEWDALVDAGRLPR